MSRAAITPRTHERPFGHHELFFSTTDPKGIIRTGNDVFVRVSGHPVEALVGAPHNIIRHPDMPRAVFKLLWDFIGEGRPFAGYVKNMAADGGFYWVVALVVPTSDGYLSVRLKPSSTYFPIVKELYAELLAIEKSAGDEGGAWRTGMARATERLHAALGGLGFSSYADFMQAVLAAELTSHRALLRDQPSRTRAAAADAPQASEYVGDLNRLLAACGGVDRHLEQLFSQVEGFLAVINTIDAKADFLLTLSSNVHLVALNALIASCRLQRGGEGFSVVTQNLARLSRQNTETIDVMTRHLTELTASLRESAFSITAAKLQVEMTVFFLEELVAASWAEAGSPDDRRTRNGIAVLLASLSNSARQLVAAVPRAQQPIPHLRRLQDVLDIDLRSLSSVRLIGKIQAAGINEEGHFLELLDQILVELDKGSAEL